MSGAGGGPNRDRSDRTRRKERPGDRAALAVLVLVLLGTGAFLSGGVGGRPGSHAPAVYGPSEPGSTEIGLHPAVLPTASGAPAVLPESPRSLGLPVINSTPIPVGSGPRFAAYDPVDQLTYVSNFHSNNVSVINGTRVVGSVNVGTYPQFMTVDTRTGEVYVLNLGSSNASVINGTALVGTIAVGSTPESAVYDPVDGFVYVSNSGDDSVSVLNGTHLQSTLTVGFYPGGAAFNQATREVYVPLSFSASVAVIAHASVITTLSGFTDPIEAVYAPAAGGVYVVNSNGGSGSFATLINRTNVVGPHHGLGSMPVGGVYDPENGITYISDQTGSNVTPLGPPGTARSVPVGSNPGIGTFDPADGLVYIPNTNGANLTVINATTPVASVSVGSYPGTSAYDAADGYLYTPNAADEVSATFTWLPVNFTEVGIPSGTPWTVNLSNGESASSSSTNLAFFLPEGPLNYSIHSSDPRYSAPAGTLVVESSGAQVAVRFSPVLFPVYFSEEGLPAGTSWAVRFAGSTNASTGPTIPFAAINGSYRYSVEGIPGWTASGFNGSLTVLGAAANVTVRWDVTRFGVEVDERGLPVGTPWVVRLASGISYTATNFSIVFAEANGSYSFSASVSSGDYASDGGAFLVAGQSTSASVVFTPVVYPVLFAEVGLPPGTNWSVTIGSTPYFVNGTTLSLSLMNGTYPYELSGVPGWRTGEFTGTFVVEGEPVTTGISWKPVTYSIQATEHGLPDGTAWSVSLGPQVENGSTSTLLFVRGNGSYPYSVASVPGFEPASASGSVVVHGENSTIEVQFTPTSANGNGGALVLGLPSVDLYGIAALGAAAAAGAILLFVRRRKDGTPARPTTEPRRPVE